jgi:hypothetical protein
MDARGHPAGKKGAVGQGGQHQGRAREGKPATSRESYKAAGRREETSNEGTSRKEDKSNTGSGAERADARDGRGLRGWCPWWPNGRKE